MAWEKREVPGRSTAVRLKTAPSEENLTAAGIHLDQLRANALNRFLKDFARHLGRKSCERNEAGYYRNMKELDVKGKRAFTLQTSRMTTLTY